MATRKPPPGKSFSAPSSTKPSPTLQTKITTMLQKETEAEEPKSTLVDEMFQKIMNEIQHIRKGNLSTSLELLEAQRKITNNNQKIEGLEGGAVGMKEEKKDFKKQLTNITDHMSRIDFERMSFF